MATKTSTKVKSTARDVFSYLLLIVTLYIGVISFITLLFQYINNLFPSDFPLFSEVSSGLVITAASSLIISWPIFIFISWLIGRDIKKNPAKHDIGVKRWLVYLTLFIAAITIIITLITLVNSFLSGELTLKVGLKVLVMLVVTGGVFGYYIWDSRRKGGTKSLVSTIFAWVTSAIVVGSIIAGFFIIGTPGEQRAMRFDDRRVDDLQFIQFELFNFYSQKDQLPQTLAELETDITGFVVPLDPDTDLPYQYQATGPLTFEICAIFETKSETEFVDDAAQRVPEFGLVPFPSENFEHGIGLTCFERTIDPDLLEPIPNR